MKKFRKIFSLVFAFVLMIGLSACEENQQRIAIGVEDEDGNPVTNDNLYIIDDSNVKTKITTPSFGDYYILIKKTNENGQVIDEEVKEINEAVEYEIKDLPKDEMVTFNIYTALTIDGDDVKISEDDNLPSFRFALKNSPEGLKEAKKKEELQGYDNKYELFANQAYGDNTKIDVIEGVDDEGNKAITRLNVTTKEEVFFKTEGAADTFLERTSIFLRKLKEEGLPYESVFAVCKVDTVDKYGNSGDPLPLCKIEVSKETADEINFDNFVSQNLKDIAEYYEFNENL